MSQDSMVLSHGKTWRMVAVLVAALVASFGVSAQEIESSEAWVDLATFELGSEHTAQFIGFPERGEVAYVETGRGEDARPLFDRYGELPALDAYLVLAPENAPLPRLLVENHRQVMTDGLKPGLATKFEPTPTLDLEQLIASRGVVESVGRLSVDASSEAVKARFSRYTGQVPSVDLDLKASSGHGTGGWNCANSANTFESWFCNGSGGSGRIDKCHKYAFTGELIHDSYQNGWHKRKYSFGITAACNDHIDVAHDYWNGSSWKNRLHITNLPSGFWMWHRYQGNGQYYRRVLHRTVFHTGYHRAYTAFYN